MMAWARRALRRVWMSPQERLLEAVQAIRDAGGIEPVRIGQRVTLHIPRSARMAREQPWVNGLVLEVDRADVAELAASLRLLADELEA